MSEIIPYDQKYFDAGYYGGGARGGFPSYRYDDPEQQKQLDYKLQDIGQFTKPCDILFVGCALGFEVKRFLREGYNTMGVDISEYAIEHAEKDVAHRCEEYDGCRITMPDRDFDVVAAFDVLTLVPDDMMEKLARDMRRVSRQRIIFRTIVKRWHDHPADTHGLDGVSFRYHSLEEWCRLFEQDGDFKLERANLGYNSEGIISFIRK